MGMETLCNLNTTRHGNTCQAWSSQSPHQHTQDNFWEGIDGAMNYCRNPDFSDGGLWCYTTNPDVRWEYCDVTLCEDEELLQR